MESGDLLRYHYCEEASSMSSTTQKLIQHVEALCSVLRPRLLDLRIERRSADSVYFLTEDRVYSTIRGVRIAIVRCNLDVAHKVRGVLK